MEKKITVMTDRPELGMIIGSFAYYYVCYMLVPFIMPLAAKDIYYNHMLSSWMEMGYHLFNAIVVFFIAREYIFNSFYYVLTKPKEFAKSVLTALGMAVVAFGVGAAALGSLGGSDLIFTVFPITDLNVLLVPYKLLAARPLLGTLCMVLVEPLLISFLFYAPGFAPACCRRPWLGYTMITVLFALFHGFEYLWHMSLEYALVFFLVRLPVHIIACWSYQKSNTVWAPVAVLGLFNLIVSLICIIAM